MTPRRASLCGADRGRGDANGQRSRRRVHLRVRCLGGLCARLADVIFGSAIHTGDARCASSNCGPDTGSCHREASPPGAPSRSSTGLGSAAIRVPSGAPAGTSRAQDRRAGPDPARRTALMPGQGSWALPNACHCVPPPPPAQHQEFGLHGHAWPSRTHSMKAAMPNAPTRSPSCGSAQIGSRRPSPRQYDVSDREPVLSAVARRLPPEAIFDDRGAQRGLGTADERDSRWRRLVRRSGYACGARKLPKIGLASCGRARSRRCGAD
jgi:hypothetical protein